jgi:phosphomannomutase
MPDDGGGGFAAQSGWLFFLTFILMSELHPLLNQIRFGTSGVRDRVENLSPEVCFALVHAFVRACGGPSCKKVVLGHDLRPSSPAMALACAAALVSLGVSVIFVGVLPTPALAWHARQQRCPAVMVTGSHIPFDRNGIKFYDADGEISKAQEQAILDALHWPEQPVILQPLPDVNPLALQAYVHRYTSFFRPGLLNGKRIGFYEHSSTGRDVLPAVLRALGARVLSLGRSDTFVPVDTEAVSAHDAALGRAWAHEHKLDALISTDGDADRPLIADESGHWLRGDVVGVITARHLGVHTVVTPVSSNTMTETCAAFGQVVRTRIGSPYVVAAMQSALAQQSGHAAAGAVAGFEANGGFLLMSDVHNDQGSVLHALPTRDALLPILAVLAEADRLKYPISALQQTLPPRFTASDRLQDFPREMSSALLDDLRIQPQAWLQRCLGQHKHPVQLDNTDGVRITLQNGDIVHLRPSGNAPELRCYAEADTEEKAVALANQVLAYVQFLCTNS